MAHTHPELIKLGKTLNHEAFGLSDQRFLSYFLGVGSMVGISLISFLMLMMLPFGSKSTPLAQKAQDYWLGLLVSFAVGALLGDAFLHLIPAALGVHSHAHGKGDEGHGQSHGHSHGKNRDTEDPMEILVPCLSILGGMLLFFSIAKMMRSYTGGHGHSHAQEDPAAKGVKKAQQKKALQPAAYLNTIADMVHNFTDGLALGTSWGRGTALGLTTTFAVFFHEIPHELGDMGASHTLHSHSCQPPQPHLLQAFSSNLVRPSGKPWESTLCQPCLPQLGLQWVSTWSRIQHSLTMYSPSQQEASYTWPWLR